MPLIGHADPTEISISTTNSTDDTAATHTHAVVASSNPGAAEELLKSTVTGGLTLQELTIMVEANLAKLTATQVGSHLIPDLTDTHDLGSSTKLWRKGWISELESVLFAQNSASIIGGWFVIPKASGTLSADVDDVQAMIDFGQTMTPNDFVLLRTSGAVEYIQVGTLDSGTTYNVTRDVDGSGANSWPSGQVYMVLGNMGNGRIELNAQDTPRISVLEQGATYNTQTERVRIGEMTSWGTYIGNGFGVGNPSGERIAYTPSTGLEIVGDGGNLTNINGGNIQTNTVTATQISVTNLSALSANLGTITAGTINGATIIAGNGQTIMDDNGYRLNAIDVYGAYNYKNAIRFIDPNYSSWDRVKLWSQSGINASSFVVSLLKDSNTSQVDFEFTQGSTPSLKIPGDLLFYNGSTAVGQIGTTDTTWLRINNAINKNIYTNRMFRADGGIVTGSASSGYGQITYTNALRSYKSGAYRTGYLTYQHTTATDHRPNKYSAGENYVTLAGATGVPSNAKGAYVTVLFNPATNGTWIRLWSWTGSTWTSADFSQQNQTGYWRSVSGLLFFNHSGQIRYTLSHTLALDVNIFVTAYYL